MTTTGKHDDRRVPNGDTAEVRPSRGRLATLFILIGLLTAAVLWVAVPIARGVIHTYGVRDNRAEVAWRSIVPEFGDARGCARCHDTEHTRLMSDKHQAIGCQSCHGALAEHEAKPEVGVVTPSSEVCLKCHTKVQGKPDALHAIVTSKHYIATCLACHDPHTTVAKRPPVVSHTMKGIPACITCHGPGQFRQPSMRHPDVSRQTDASCLQCHKAGRGPGQEATNG